MVSRKKLTIKWKYFFNFIKETQISSRQSKAVSYLLVLLIYIYIYGFHELCAFERNVAKIKLFPTFHF